MSKLIIASLLALSLSFSSATIAAPRALLNSLCHIQGVTCIKVAKGQTWETLFPDPTVRYSVMRANRMDTSLRRGMNIAVPTDPQQTQPLEKAPFDQQIEPVGEKLIIFDPSELAWAAYDSQGHLVRWGAASGGSNWCSDINDTCHTPAGKYEIYRKGGAECRSSEFPLGKGGAPMPYCMHFHRGFAVHGSPEVPGYNASHGCVRIFVEDAQWLNENFVDLPTVDNGYKGTDVIILPYKM